MRDTLVQFNLSSRKMLWVLVLWQFIAVLLMSLGVWPEWLIWINLGLIIGFIAATDTFDGLLLLIASIPFYVAVPNSFVPGLPMWRILFAWMFAVWAVRTLYKQREYVQKMLRLRQLYQENAQSKIGLLMTTVRRIDSRFMSWDKYIALFLFVMVLSLAFAHFKIHAIKQILFLINVFFLYIVLINSTTTRERVIDLIKYAALSTGIIVALGYVQFIATLFSSPYYFWQYWAVMVSRIYYGQGLSDVLIYSNSWFSYDSSGQSLRMFSIMPDSHSFGMVAVLCMAFTLPLLVLYKSGPQTLWHKVLGRTYWMWYAIRFSGLAVILSGTRGLWVGMLPTLFITVFLYVRKFARSMIKKALIAQLLIILSFVLAPLINMGLHYLRVSQYEENFVERAQSIYDLEESSNVGRLVIWEESLTYAALHPLGVGYGNFIVSVVRDIPAGYSFEQLSAEKNLRYNLPQKFVSAHSLYLSLLVELGIVGLLVFILLFWKIIMPMWRFVKQHKNTENVFTMMIVSMLMLTVWFLAYGIFDVTLFNDKVLIYFFIGLGISGIIIRRYRSFESESHKQQLSGIITK